LIIIRRGSFICWSQNLVYIEKHDPTPIITCPNFVRCVGTYHLLLGWPRRVCLTHYLSVVEILLDHTFDSKSSKHIFSFDNEDSSLSIVICKGTHSTHNLHSIYTIFEVIINGLLPIFLLFPLCLLLSFLKVWTKYLIIRDGNKLWLFKCNVFNIKVHGS